MKLESRLKKTATAAGVPYETVLKDFAIGHVLSALAAEKRLAGTLVMKGGTALRKLYFANYRFSEDLDFTARDAPRGDDLEAALRSVARRARERMEAHGAFAATLDRVVLKEEHPGAQEAFVIRIRFPWQREPLCVLKAEITTDEPILIATDARSVLHGYEEDLPGLLLCYSLEEIVCEKLRALLQNEERRKRRAWIRPRCRDFYDLWTLLATPPPGFDAGAVRRSLPAKCEVRAVSFRSWEDFFPEHLVALVVDAWKGDLGGLVPEVPEAATVVRELSGLVAKLLDARG
jgi:uncharacterized protein